MAEIESFITMLRAACDDSQVHAQLERLLAMPDDRRKSLVHAWVSDLIIAQAPRDFIAAIACLSDDAVAEAAYAAIFNCGR